jgi:hypothetical protein
VQIVEPKNQALGRVLRNKFLTTPDALGNFARESFTGNNKLKAKVKESVALHWVLREFLQRVPVVAPAGSEPWGWQLLRFTNVSFGEALHGRPGVRSKAVESMSQGEKGTVRVTASRKAPKSGLRDLLRNERCRIGKGIAVIANASGIGTGAPFAIAGFVGSSTER